MPFPKKVPTEGRAGGSTSAVIVEQLRRSMVLSTYVLTSFRPVASKTALRADTCRQKKEKKLERRYW